MFWKRRGPTATKLDQEWLHEAIQELLLSFGAERLLALPTLTPNTRHFNFAFKGTEEDVQFVLKQVCGTMGADIGSIDLVIEEDRDVDLGQGIRISTADRKGYSSGAAGTYREQRHGRYEIVVSASGLNDTQGLIATLAHEVAHIKLLGERRMDHNDPDHELFTDLAVILHGYGIFQANSVITQTQWSDGQYSGWSVGRKGYLPQEIVAYALALLVVLKNEMPEWDRYLNSGMRKYFKRNRDFLLANPEIERSIRNQLRSTP